MRLHWQPPPPELAKAAIQQQEAKNGSVLYSLFDTVSLNNLKLSKDIYLGGNFHTKFAVISNTFGLIIQKLR